MQRGVPEEQITVVYNWCDEIQMLLETESDDRYSLSDHFNVVFAGTMGKLQALDSIIQAARILRDELPGVRFVFVGDGVDLPALRNLASELEAHNVVFIPRQPVHRIGRVLQHADVLLIHLKDVPVNRAGIPQKTQACMAFGKPILMAVRGEAADIVTDAGAGIICEPENPQSIADTVRRFYGMQNRERLAMGARGANYYRDNLSFKIGMEKILAVFEETTVARV